MEARSVRGLAHMVFAAHSTPARRLEKLFYDLLSLISIIVAFAHMK